MIRFFTDNPELYNDWRWVWTGPWSITSLVVLGIFLLLALFFAWRTSSRLPSLGQRFLLLTLRLVLATGFWFLLVGPGLELRHVQKTQNYLPVYVDTSASMRAKARKGSASRLEKAKTFFQNNKAFFSKLAGEQKVRWFSFDRGIRPIQGMDAIAKLKANGDQTDLLRIARDIQERFQDKPMAGVVLVTDGIDTLALSEQTSGISQKSIASQRRQRTGRRLRHLVQALKQQKIPVHLVVPNQDGKALRDIAVTDVYGDSFAFLHNTATLEVRVTAQGFGSLRVPVSLYREGALLKSKVVQLQPGQREYLVSFKFKPRKAGKFIYSVRVPLMSGESVAENNEKSFILKTIRDRIRVLQVVGQPSWDVRFLRRLLKKNASIDLISFFIMRTHHNIQNVPLQDIALIPFPARELFTKALSSFDLVIFQNFNYGPYLRRSYLANIARFIREGGAFVMVGGDLSFGAGGYIGTSLEGTLPVRLGLGRVDGNWFLPGLTSEGEHHPVTRLFANVQENKRLWASLPKVPGTNIVGEAHSDSLVLLRHPFLKTDSGKALPVLSVKEHGKGRVMALTVDGSWRWNFTHTGKGGTREPYYRFWNNAIRWLIRDPELEHVQVTTFRSSYRQGEPARFRIRMLNRKYQPRRQGKATLRVETVPNRKLVHKTVQKLQSNGMISYSWKPPKPGMYRLITETTLENGAVSRGEELFQVRGVYDEFQKIHPDRKLFASIQKATGGRILSFGDKVNDLAFKPATVVRVDRSRTVDLWDNIPILAIFFFLMAVEWWLRRHWGLP